jgi:hypothetical protein
MAITMVKKKSRNGHTRPRPVTLDLNSPGRLRVGHWLTLLSISATTFYKRLNAGVIPPASGNDGKPYWNTKVVRDFLNGSQS